MQNGRVERPNAVEKIPHEKGNLKSKNENQPK